MTNPNYTHLTLVVDRSGSMESMRDDAQGGIKTLVTEQFAEPGTISITMVEFDNEFSDVARMAAKPFDYQLHPRGGTALLDAVGREIARTGEDLAAMPEDQRPGKVIFVVVTDGQENSSHEFTIETVRSAINRQKISFGWEFQFIGAGEAAWQAEELGMNMSRMNATGKGQKGAYGSLNASLKTLRIQQMEADRLAYEGKLNMPENIPDED